MFFNDQQILYCGVCLIPVVDVDGVDDADDDDDDDVDTTAFAPQDTLYHVIPSTSRLALCACSWKKVGVQDRN
jgi:hypothetical protein